MMDDDTIKSLITFIKPFFLNGDFLTYDEFNLVILPLIPDDINDEYSKATKELEKHNPELLKKYVEHFNYQYDVPIDTAWGFYSDKSE